jgi:hypothetical protein
LAARPFPGARYAASAKTSLWPRADQALQSMQIQAILLKTPPQFKVESVEDDTMVLVPTDSEVDENTEGWLGRVNPGDRIVVETFGTPRMSHFGAMNRYRKERLGIPEGSASMGIASDEDKKLGFLICLYRLDTKTPPQRKVFFIKTGVAGGHRYFARVELNKPVSTGSGVTNTELAAWSMFLSENVGTLDAPGA